MERVQRMVDEYTLDGGRLAQSYRDIQARFRERGHERIVVPPKKGLDLASLLKPQDVLERIDAVTTSDEDQDMEPPARPVLRIPGVPQRRRGAVLNVARRMGL